MTTRIALHAFELANPIYKNASVSFYTVANGVKTSTLATLYSGLTGSAQLSNPQKLNSHGQLKQAVYIEDKVIGSISGISVAGHDTGIFTPGIIATFITDTGTWVTATDYEILDLVKHNTGLYLCLVPHRSGNFTTNYGSGYWNGPLQGTAICS